MQHRTADWVIAHILTGRFLSLCNCWDLWCNFIHKFSLFNKSRRRPYVITWGWIFTQLYFFNFWESTKLLLSIQTKPVMNIYLIFLHTVCISIVCLKLKPKVVIVIGLIYYLSWVKTNTFNHIMPTKKPVPTCIFNCSCCFLGILIFYTQGPKLWQYW